MKQKITNAVIGNPLGHSLGPIWHGEMYRHLDINGELVKDEGADISKLVEHIRSKPYELTAVTTPHKESILELLDVIDKEAREIGAVNTVINKDDILTGYNTDVNGIEYALRDIDLAEKSILVVGAGGATRAIMHVLKKNGANINCINRTKEKAQKLMDEFGGKVLVFGDLNPEDIDVIINTTPVGMYPNIDDSPVPKDFIRSKHIVFDIVYNPIDTRLLQDAKNVGAQTILGLDMFIAQGLKQIELWQGVEIDIEKHLDRLKTLLINNLKPNF